MELLYPNRDVWHEASAKRVALFGMSGLGKTYLSNMLRAGGDWFHYSVDYRIGTRYMGEHIADNFKREAMKVPFLAELLRSDSIYVASNLTFDNLAPLSTYLGMPGDPSKGGLPFDEYLRRQEQHRAAEVSAMLETPQFIERARALYGYDHFVCDTSGSICEVARPDDPDDPVMTAMARNHLMVWIEGTEDHADLLAARFDAAPKPMYYRPEVLCAEWDGYLARTGVAPDAVDPMDFARSAYRSALATRAPLYRAMAEWGVTVSAEDVADVRDTSGFETLIGRAIARRGART